MAGATAGGVTASIAFVFFSCKGVSIAFELVAATIGAKMLDFFDNYEVELFLAYRESWIKPPPFFM